MARSELKQTTLTATLLSFLDIIAAGDVRSTARFFGKQQRYEQDIARFNELSDSEKAKKNEDALREAEIYRTWYPFDLDGKLDRNKDAYPQLCKLGYELRLSEYKKYLTHDPGSYLDNIEDCLPLATLMRKGERTIGKIQLRDQGRRVAIAMNVSYAIPKGLLSAARMKTFYGEGASYCVVLTEDVERVMQDYGPERPMFGEVNPATDLDAFRPVKSVTIKCNLICERRGDWVGMQVGRGEPFAPKSFGSFCILKYNFRTPELGSLTFWEAEKNGGPAARDGSQARSVQDGPNHTTTSKPPYVVDPKTQVPEHFTGVWTQRYMSGNIASRGQYLNGRRHGEFVSWHDGAGGIMEEAEFQNGRRLAAVEYFRPELAATKTVSRRWEMVGPQRSETTFYYPMGPKKTVILTDMGNFTKTIREYDTHGDLLTTTTATYDRSTKDRLSTVTTTNTMACKQEPTAKPVLSATNEFIAIGTATSLAAPPPAEAAAQQAVKEGRRLVGSMASGPAYGSYLLSLLDKPPDKLSPGDKEWVDFVHTWKVPSRQEAIARGTRAADGQAEYMADARLIFKVVNIDRAGRRIANFAKPGEWFWVVQARMPDGVVQVFWVNAHTGTSMALIGELPPAKPDEGNKN